MNTSEYILEAKNISKEFPGVKALDDVTLKIRAGTVHALIGENGAGKSTLMKCLFGIYKQDSGDIFLNNKKVDIENSRAALDCGISMIHQELHPVPHRSVMENIWLGRFPVKKVGPLEFIDHKKMYDDTKELFIKLGMDIKPDTIVKNMSVSKIQSMEIAKATSYNSKVIIMDEPTSSLTENEVEHLFRIINSLKSQGVAIIYISHKIEEILKIADEVSIMRDGKHIGTWLSSEITTEFIISKMVGRDLSNRFPERTNIPGDVIMKVENFTSPIQKSFKDISFELKKGEILGIGGLVGAQRTELVEAIFGLRGHETGEIYIDGKSVKIKSPIDAIKHKIALLTEERRTTGIFPVLQIIENITIANLSSYLKPYLLLDEKKRRRAAEDNIKKLSVKTPSYKSLIKDLSGGNQQKC